MLIYNSQDCIYCKESNSAKNAEHIVNEFLGARLTLEREVCAECNTGYFSRFDTSFKIFLTTLDPIRTHPAIGSTPTKFFEGKVSLHEVPNEKFWIALRHQKNGQLVPFYPQIALPPGDKVHFIGRDTDNDALILSAIQELKRTQSLKLTSPRWLTEEGTPPEIPLLVRTFPKTYAIVAQTDEQCSAVKEQILTGQLGAKLEALRLGQSRSKSMQPTSGTITASYADPRRTIAKMAFNFACHVMGYDTIIRPEFDEMRRFIRYGEEPSSAGIEFFSPEERAHVQTTKWIARRLCETRGHKIILFHQPGKGVFVVVFLYETPMACMYLAPRGSLRDVAECIYLGVFDYATRTEKILSLDRDRASLPEFLGVRTPDDLFWR